MRSLGVLLCLAATASAAEPTPREEARARFNEGLKLYQAGRYRDAAQRFADAYALAPLPDLLFNEAQAWHHDFERTGDHGSAQKAASLFRRYLDVPNMPAGDRDIAAAQLDRLERDLPELKPAPPPPPVAPLAPPEPPPPPSRRGLWIGLGVGAAVVVAALAIGLGVGLSASSGGPTVMARW